MREFKKVNSVGDNWNIELKDDKSNLTEIVANVSGEENAEIIVDALNLQSDKRMKIPKMSENENGFHDVISMRSKVREEFADYVSEYKGFKIVRRCVGQSGTQYQYKCGNLRTPRRMDVTHHIDQVLKREERVLLDLKGLERI